MIKPTIGRVVLVTRDGVQSPALIAFVHGDTLINVGGFDAGGGEELVSDNRLSSGSGCYRRMPTCHD